MAVHFISEKPQKLLNNFDAKIVQKEQSGKIVTWEKSDDGMYYTHKAKEWTKKAWFKAKVGTDRLTFNIVKPKNSNVAILTYAYYHGHLIETFLNHFDHDFSSGRATALAESGDVCG